MKPYERLMAEAIPTGRFGRPDVDSQAHKEPGAKSTPEQQAARRAVLDEAQRGWLLPDECSKRNRERVRPGPCSRHLHLVPDPTDTQAA
ncbi:hypothetical protein [Streptomyces sp. NPDC059455]|uniref:hypothetical protein n=1 Tax=Streptomyces sp. NPDC059455 TaxID=3346837 RepID=UPI0036A44684